MQLFHNMIWLDRDISRKETLLNSVMVWHHSFVILFIRLLRSISKRVSWKSHYFPFPWNDMALPWQFTKRDNIQLFPLWQHSSVILFIRLLRRISKRVISFHERDVILHPHEMVWLFYDNSPNRHSTNLSSVTSLFSWFFSFIRLGEYILNARNDMARSWHFTKRDITQLFHGVTSLVRDSFHQTLFIRLIYSTSRTISWKSHHFTFPRNDMALSWCLRVLFIRLWDVYHSKSFTTW